MNFLNSKLLVSISVIALATTLVADKPSWAGKGKPPTVEQRESHKDLMKSKAKKNSFKNKKRKNMDAKVEKYRDSDAETVHQIPNPFAN